MAPRHHDTTTPSLSRLSPNSHILILGLASEGWSTCQFLARHYPQLKELILADQKPLEELKPQWRKLITQQKHFKYLRYQHLKELDLTKFDLIIKSPGISLPGSLSQKLSLTSNTQLFFDHLPSSAITIGVTGTKGKSTTSALIHHVLQTSGWKASLGGNIGIPPLDLLSKPSKIYVLELSCHQLSTLKSSPHIAVIQNISEEHLDYYPDFASYIQAKSQIARFQTQADVVIFNRDYPIPRQIARLSPGQKLTFQLRPLTWWQKLFAQPVAYLKNQTIYLHQQKVLGLNDIPLVGAHNLDNVMPAILVGRTLKLSLNQIIPAIKTFHSLPHRLELVAQFDQVKYYNDSLSTTPIATIAALNSFPDQTIVLIAGGFDRGLDFSALAQKLSQVNLRALILFSPTGEKIKQNLLKLAPKIQLPLIKVNNMASAVKQARSYAQAGDVVLLSPGSASFGLFQNYADRGDQFKKHVLDQSR